MLRGGAMLMAAEDAWLPPMPCTHAAQQVSEAGLVLQNLQTPSSRGSISSSAGGPSRLQSC